MIIPCYSYEKALSYRIISIKLKLYPTHIGVSENAGEHGLTWRRSLRWVPGLAKCWRSWTATLWSTIDSWGKVTGKTIQSHLLMKSDETGTCPAVDMKVYILGGGFTVTILKIWKSMGRIIPYIMENQKCLKPPLVIWMKQSVMAL